jgi:simple sugar transport system ATP-binding protein
MLEKENIYYTPSDRLEKGLFSDLTLIEHMALSDNRNNFINWKKIKEYSSKKINEFNIKGNLNSQAKELSGGNQQKLQLSLIPDRKGLLAIEQPTRGLDLNSTQSVWNKINERINDDICLFFSTTDIDEVWDQSDWIISFSGEKITDISEKKNIKKSDIKYFISGVKNK